jgi:EmrB/QacA subfamily drug resistance transporter
MSSVETPRANSQHSRWILIASILGSGAAFLEGSVVSVALPAIGRDLGLGVVGLEAIANGYLLTLSALMLLGGALGDHFKRTRVFAIGLYGFAVACAGCALAPTFTVLVAFRVLQGVFSALLVPNSLAMLETAFTGDARGVAIGQWSAWSAVSTALGPLLGGWLADTSSWRWVFAIMIPFAVAAAVIARRHGDAVDGTPADRATPRPIDYAGAALITLALAGVVGSLTLATKAGPTSLPVVALAVFGVGALAGWIALEKRNPHPLVPLAIFRSREFAGANLMTLLVYAALSGLLFMLMLELQDELGLNALQAGASLLPVNVLLLLVSPTAGRVAHRIGARIPLTAGAIITALGMALFTRLHPGVDVLATVLPAVLVVGFGLAILVAPLTATALGALDDEHAGLASGVNNAVARLAGLLATAALPFAAGVGASDVTHPGAFTAGFQRAMWINAAVCAAGGVVAWLSLTPSTQQNQGQEATRG